MKLKFNPNIAAGVTTFLRDDSLFYLIKSFQQYYPEIKLYIVDQGIETDKKNELYSSLLAQGHQIKYISYNCGISKARKILKETVKESFLLYTEDDFEVNKKANIYKLLDIITQDKSLGVIGGQCRNPNKNNLESYNYFFAKANKTLLYIPASYYLDLGLLKWKEINDTKYHYTDIIADYSLWRKEISPSIFDENICQVEHSFIYLKLKYETKWKVGFCPDCIVTHYHNNTNTKYNKERVGGKKREKDLNYIYNYCNIDKMVYLDKTNILPDIVNKSSIIPTSIVIKPKIEKISIIKSKPKIIQKYNKIDLKTIKQILCKLYDNTIDFVIVKNSCLDAIRFKKLATNTKALEIAVKNRDDLKKIERMLSEQELNQINIYIDIFKKTKMAELYNQKIKIPFPVVTYLEKLYGQNWKEYEK